MAGRQWSKRERCGCHDHVDVWNVEGFILACTLLILVNFHEGALKVRKGNAFSQLHTTVHEVVSSERHSASAAPISIKRGKHCPLT